MFDGKSILITGGTGSFGQAFIKHLLTRHKPCRVAVYSRDELKQYDMQQEFSGPEMRCFIGDVQGRGLLVHISSTNIRHLIVLILGLKTAT